MTVVATDEVLRTLKGVEELFLELTNVKIAEFSDRTPAYASNEGWVSAVEGDVQVFLDTQRDEKLLGEGLMRDLARRVQALRKELGYVPTDVLSDVFVAELDDENVRLLEPFKEEMQELVRATKVHLQGKRQQEEAGKDWRECRLDDKLLYVAVSR
jgi:isoleucyl-tRNA synthetase